MTNIKETFTNLISKYTNNNLLPDKLWNEINTKYSENARYYHTLEHLSNLLFLLDEVKDKINDWDTTLFAVYYHDVIYDANNSKNEDLSADIAKLRLKELSVTEIQIEKCVAMILATKGHSDAKDNDTNYFTDADLSILGQDKVVYLQYSKQIKKEYSIFPDGIYNPGRKKVLSHFLKMERIFKTQYFFDKFEKQARENLLNEFNTL